MRTLALLCVGLALPLLAACDSLPLLRDPIAPPLPPVAPQVAVYDCEGQPLTVRSDEQAMELWWAQTPRSAPLRLVAAPGASGVRYAGAGISFRSEGDRARIEGPGEDRRCRLLSERRPWREAWLRGVDFRAVGQEPGWQLELTEGGETVLIRDYGAHRERWTTPPATAIEHGWRREVEGLRIDWLVQDCEDLMSGQRYPARVRLLRDGETLQGCGERL
jgi:putative lipoprotein